MVLLLQNLIILLILLFVFCVSLRKIERGVYLIVFLLPVYLLRMEIFGVPTTALELGIYVLFIIWLAETYRSGQLKEEVSKIFSDRLLAAGAFLLIAGAVISTIFSVDMRTSAGILKGWFFDPLLFFVVLISTIKTLEQKENVLKVFFASGFGVAAISLIYWLSPSLGGVSYDGRLHAFYDSPNYLAMYLAPALIIGVWGFILPAGKNVFSPNKYYWLVLLSVIASVIYLTFSYAAWVAVFIAIFFQICFTAIADGKPGFHWKPGFLGKGDWRKGITLAIIVFLIFFATILTQIGTGKFNNLKNLAYRSSFNSRLMIWRAAWEIGKDHPIFGIGPGNFQRYYLDYQKRFSEPYLEWAVPEPHNVFLAFWLETGILGLAGFIILIFWFFKKTFSSLKKARLDSSEAKRAGNASSQGLVIVLCSIMIYTLLHGLVDTTYWKNDLAIIFWMVLGLSVAAKTDIPKSAQKNV